MKSIMTIDGISYDFYSTKSHVTKEEMMGARDYNEGMDAFWGCDFLTVYAYMVKKENTKKFIKKIKGFIKQIEELELDDEDLDPYESMNHFAFAHKIVEGSEYDFFFTDFDNCLLQEDQLIDEHEELTQELEDISDFFVYAGANASDDTSLEEFALSYFADKHLEVFKRYYDEDFVGYAKRYDYESFQMKEDAEDKILTFIEVYFTNNPKQLRGNNFIAKMIKESK